MNHRLPLVALAAAAGAFALTGCGSTTTRTPIAMAPAPTTSAASSLSPSPQASPVGKNLDPCLVVTRADAEHLSGRAVTRVEKKDGCRYQLSTGELVVWLGLTNATESPGQHPDARTVPGLGDKAYTVDGHLIVRYGTLRIDVFASGGSNADNLLVEKATAKHVIDWVG